jgi:hypothetical protein
MHIASERLWPWPLRTKATSLSVVTSTLAWVLHAVLGMCILFSQAGLAVRLGFWTPLWMTRSVMD